MRKVWKLENTESIQGQRVGLSRSGICQEQGRKLGLAAEGPVYQAVGSTTAHERLSMEVLSHPSALKL